MVAAHGQETVYTVLGAAARRRGAAGLFLQLVVSVAATTALLVAVPQWWSLAFLILTGGLMIVGEPIRELVNPYFWIKMILIVVGVIVAVMFAKALGRQAEAVGGGVRSAGLLLVVLWLMIMWCGRWIAYAPV